VEWEWGKGTTNGVMECSSNMFLNWVFGTGWDWFGKGEEEAKVYNLHTTC